MRTKLMAWSCAALVALAAPTLHAAPPRSLGLETTAEAHARPLQRITVLGASEGTLLVHDGRGREYVRVPAAPRVTFTIGGSLGTQTITLVNDAGESVLSRNLEVDAATHVEDEGGPFGELYEMAERTLTVRDPSGDNGGAGVGGHGDYTWRGRHYKLFVPWVLDQSQTSKGMAFFSPHVRDGVELFRDSQKADGMIWSFVIPDSGRSGHYDQAYGPLGYVMHDGGALFVRQPVENHVEYEYVNMLYTAWKATGDDALMMQSLDSAMRALDYSVTDPVRFSRRHGLLKRGYTIDSWDFQVEDEHTVADTVSPRMTINPEQTKFGVFFGDNTGYAYACARLAEMLERAGRSKDAQRFRARQKQIADNLAKLAWNGRFFRHFVSEDPRVKRDLGVDEAAQIAQGNMYSLNRGISHAQAVAILRTYQQLGTRLPEGSPGEWYSIYPPFQRGFGSADTMWQYMNGAVSGHAAGELARGAMAHGFESYGASVLLRSHALAARTDGKIHFAYTGAAPDDAKGQTFTPVDLRALANMDTTSPSPSKPWMDGEPGNDVAHLPAGTLKVGGAPFALIDPAQNERRAVLAVARRPGYPSEVEVPVGDRRATALYLMHTSHLGRRTGGAAQDGIASGVMFRYTDGSERGVYLQRGKHVSGWWYPELSGERAGVAWRGPNEKTGDVGLTWALIENPEPNKTIRSIVLSASLEGSVYAVAAMTLTDRLPRKAFQPISYGGPDNWAASNMMLALLEGLGGVRDTDRALETAELSPRWTATDVGRAQVIARYGASRGYVAYELEHQRAARTLRLTVTGSGRQLRLRVLLPAGSDT